MHFLLSEADRAIGALNIVATVLPSPDLLVGLFIQKETLLLSQIEGTQSTLQDVLGAELCQGHASRAASPSSR